MSLVEKKGNAMTPFTLGLDLDGVCGDYVQEFRVRVARATGTDPALLPEPNDWLFSSSWPPVEDLEHYLELHANAVRDGMFRAMSAMEGARAALWDLSNQGVHIRVITHRLIGKELHQQAATDTVAWLDRHNIPYRDLCFVSTKSHVDANVYIDDAPHNISSLADAGKDIIIFDASYNRKISEPGGTPDYSHLTRVINWEQAHKAVLERFNAWNDSQ
jgi:5'-nucleotidase